MKTGTIVSFITEFLDDEDCEMFVGNLDNGSLRFGYVGGPMLSAPKDHPASNYCWNLSKSILIGLWKLSNCVIHIKP